MYCGTSRARQEPRGALARLQRVAVVGVSGNGITSLPPAQANVDQQQSQGDEGQGDGRLKQQINTKVHGQPRHARNCDGHAAFAHMRQLRTSVASWSHRVFSPFSSLCIHTYAYKHHKKHTLGEAKLPPWHASGQEHDALWRAKHSGARQPRRWHTLARTWQTR